MEITQPTWDVEGDTAAMALGGTQGVPTNSGYLGMATTIVVGHRGCHLTGERAPMAKEG